ncbi:uncharacterized protein J3D65DRAFT_620066 [Phyllosticta citribraziliensis]|uniref:Uncharacterized protein n=1 Tax=Phyllosticta citribraziliensis TaxID=989973 RepID=A0ABR1LXF2_9PEZI
MTTPKMRKGVNLAYTAILRTRTHPPSHPISSHLPTLRRREMTSGVSQRNSTNSLSTPNFSNLVTDPGKPPVRTSSASKRSSFAASRHSVPRWRQKVSRFSRNSARCSGDRGPASPHSCHSSAASGDSHSHSSSSAAPPTRMQHAALVSAVVAQRQASAPCVWARCAASRHRTATPVTVASSARVGRAPVCYAVYSQNSTLMDSRRLAWRGRTILSGAGFWWVYGWKGKKREEEKRGE